MLTACPPLHEYHRSATYRGEVAVAPSVLDDTALTQRVTFIFKPKPALVAPASELRDAWFTIVLRATHSDPEPQRAADNTPWVRAEVLPPATDPGGPPPGDEDAGVELDPDTDAGLPSGEVGAPGAVAVFLDSGELRAWGELEPNGRGELSVLLTRSPTRTGITTTVDWEVAVWGQVELSEGLDVHAPLPWDVVVRKRGGRR